MRKSQHAPYTALVEIAKQRGYTKNDLAEKLGMHRTTLHRKIKGKSEFSGPEMLTLIKHLRASAEEIFKTSG